LRHVKARYSETTETVCYMVKVCMVQFQCFILIEIIFDGSINNDKKEHLQIKKETSQSCLEC